MLFVLLLSFLGRVFLARNRRKLEGSVGTGSISLGRYFGRPRNRDGGTDSV